MSAEKIKISSCKFKEMSSDIAEERHHQNCKYECCGSHNDFEEFDKCPDCGMTEDIQEKHNDEVWEIIDAVEAKLLEKYEVEDES